MTVWLEAGAWVFFVAGVVLGIVFEEKGRLIWYRLALVASAISLASGLFGTASAWCDYETAILLKAAVRILDQRSDLLILSLVPVGGSLFVLLATTESFRKKKNAIFGRAGRN